VRAERRALAEGLRAALPGLAALALAAAYFAVSFSLSMDRLHALLTGNWDLGIFQQALWTGSHGGTFYESGDYEAGAVPSLLIVHPAFVLVAIAPIYGAAPTPATLFALQSGAIAATALPLYFLARSVLGRPWVALAPVAAFLVYTPMLASNLLDFHLEAFLPLEIVSLFFLWYTGRFAAGFAVAVVAFATLEIAPLLVLFLALAFLIPTAADVRRVRARWRAAQGPGRRALELLRSLTGALLRRRLVQASLGLVVASVLAYGLLRYLEWTVLPARFGGTPLVPSNGVLGYFVGVGPTQAGLPPVPPQFALGWKVVLTNWLVLYAFLAFVPWLSPRTQVLQIPWLVFTFVEDRITFSQLGWQHDLIAVAPIAIGFVFGLGFLLRLWSRHEPAPALRDESSPVRGSVGPRGPSRGLPRSAASFVVVLVAGIAIANVAYGPLGPLHQAVGPTGPGYETGFPTPAGFADVRAVADLVPPGAIVAATNRLFPLVANDRNAYVFVPTGTTGFLPGFSAAHPPSFVFLSANGHLAVPPWLRALLYDPTLYSVWGVAWMTPRGVALLYGPPDPSRAPLLAGPTPLFPQVFGADALAVGPAGERISAPSSPGGVWIRTVPTQVGFSWYGPFATVPAGHLVAALRVSVLPTSPGAAVPASAPVLSVAFAAFGNGASGGGTVTYAQAGAGNWTWVEVPLDLSQPVFNLQVLGHGIYGSGVYVDLAEVALLAPGAAPPPAPV
jgi:uncharacterized membrane protein